MKEPIRILHLEDSEYDAELIQNMIDDGGIACSIQRVATRQDFDVALDRRQFDMILSDYSLPAFDGISALALARDKAPDVPFIFVSAAMGEERAIDSLKRGATDYVLKQRLSRLVPAIQRAMQEITDRNERQRAERALHKTEQKFHAIVESSQDLIWEVDREGRIILINSSVSRLLGYPVSGVIGQESFAYLHDEDRSSLKEEFRTRVAEKAGWSGRILRWRHIDGTYLWFESNATPVLNDVHELVGFRGVDRDITRRMQAEEELRQSEERFRLITENVTDLIALLDLNGQRLYNSPSYNDILGDPMALQGTDSFREIHPGDRERIVNLFKEAVRTGIGQRAEYRLRGKDEKTRFIESQASVIKNQRGEPMNVVVVSRDVSERKKLEQQLLHAHKMESLGTLAGGIAHDFNNVLAIMLGYASMLTREPITHEHLEKSVEAMTTAIQRGAGLVRQLLTFARKSDIAFEPVNVKATVQEVVGMCSQTFPKTITFSPQVNSQLPTIIADKNQLHLALLNLCVNARDAMPAGGSITINATVIRGDDIRDQFRDASSGSYIHITVSDTGVGIDPNTVARIFEPFFTTKEIGKGTGLGLAMVYGVVNSHRGFITVSSSVGLGTTFHLYFPVTPPTGADRTSTEEVPNSVTNGTETILLVEDELSLAELVRAALEQKGYTVLVAHDGQEAVKVFAEHSEEIALVLTDLGLPKLGGLEAFKKMKKKKSDVIALVATGYLDPEQRSEMLRIGVRDFVDKPYSPNQLLRKIRLMLDARKPAS
ncbi:MAG: PAS domain S-box protein [Bacteroidetes bacterium]|nr:PAS domain S-box protein [Bacteroidota bacterium]MCW5895545.1 PAS domain S-box protein [Bacteroidota bacterium]